MTVTYAYYIFVCVTTKKKLKNMTWRPTLEDRKLMEELRAQFGVSAESELMRMGLRALAAQKVAKVIGKHTAEGMGTILPVLAVHSTPGGMILEVGL